MSSVIEESQSHVDDFPNSVDMALEVSNLASTTVVDLQVDDNGSENRTGPTAEDLNQSMLSSSVDGASIQPVSELLVNSSSLSSDDASSLVGQDTSSEPVEPRVISATPSSCQTNAPPINAWAKRSIEVSVEDSLQKALDEIRASMPTDDTGLLTMHNVDCGIDYANEKKDYLSKTSRNIVAEMHRIKCIFLFNRGSIIKSIKEMDNAIEVAHNPEPELEKMGNNWYTNFYKWLQTNFAMHEKEVCKYFGKKLQAMGRLMKTPGATASALIYATQCCALAHVLSQLKPDIVSKDVFADLIVQHGNLCVKANMWEGAQRDVNEAFRLGGKSPGFYWLQATLEVHSIKVMNAPRSADLIAKKCIFALKCANDGLAKDLQDKNLLAVKEEIKCEMLAAGMFVPSDETPKRNSGDWDLSMVNEMKIQQERARRAKENFKTSRGKDKTKSVPRKRCDSTPDSNRASVEKNAVTDIKEHSRTTPEKLTTFTRDDDSIKYVTKKTIGTVDAREHFQDSREEPKKKKVPTATLR